MEKIQTLKKKVLRRRQKQITLDWFLIKGSKRKGNLKVELSSTDLQKFGH